MASFVCSVRYLQILSALTVHFCSFFFSDVQSTSVQVEYEGHRKDLPVGSVAYTQNASWALSIAADGVCICDARHDYQPVRIIPCSAAS